jgi:PAS domain S-box-containing protein
LNEALPSVESLLRTEELSKRPSRPPNFERENRALGALAHALADSPSTILQMLADTILEVLQADSAGISLVTEGSTRLYWPAIAGLWKPHIGGGTPRDFGPCGDVLDRNRPLLFTHFERRYPHFLPMTPAAEECLVVPFHVRGKAVGTIWAISHDDRRKFDSEDLRMLVSLGTFASAAHQTVARLRAFEDEARSHGQTELSMKEMNERLLVATLRQHELAEQAQKAEMVSSKFAAIVESSHDAIISKGMDSSIISWNRGAERLFGYSADEVIGKPVALLIPAQHADEEPGILERIRRGESIDHYETVRQRKDGSLVDVSLTVSPIRDATGRIVGAAKIARDITERVRLEGNLTKIVTELAAADIAKNQFIALLAHELRAPVFAMALWIHVIQDPRVNKKTLRKGLDVILDACKSQSRLIDELLDIHRITTGKVRLDLADVELGELVRSGVESVMPAAEANNIRLSHEIDSMPVLVRGDHARLRQVVANLIGNATKFTSSGGEIRVALRTRGVLAELSVIDAGKGISSADLPHVFERFRQADPLTTRAHDGIGLGLSIAKSIVVLHGGTIAAQSAGIGKGATFTVALPLLVAERDHRVPPVMNEKSGKEPPMSLAGMLVLVVDDEGDVRQLLQVLLEEFGAETALAASAAEALDALEYRRPDVIVCDIGMPERDGYDFIRSIRALPPELGGRIPAIALTGFAASEDRDRTLSAGFQSHVGKPLDPAVLVAAIAALVAQSGGGEGPIPPIPSR